MQIRLLKFIRRTRDAKSLKLNKQFSVFIICFLIASVFWLLISLNRDYNSTITFPIVYSDLPPEKVLINELPSHVVLDINARGFDLLGYHFKLYTVPVDIKVNSYLAADKYNNYLVTKPLLASLTRQLHSDGRVIGIEPDTIFFKYNKRRNKKVPVEAAVHVLFEKQYYLSGKLTIRPDSIWISGPEIFVDSVEVIKTDKIVMKNVRASFSQSVSLNLRNLNKRVIPLTKVVTVNATIEKYTEATIEIPIEIKSNSEYRIKTIPDKVKVTYLVSLTQYSKVSDRSFTAVADFVAADPNGLKVKVDLVKMPGFIKLLKIVPSKVEYVKIK